MKYFYISGKLPLDRLDTQEYDPQSPKFLLF